MEKTSERHSGLEQVNLHIPGDFADDVVRDLLFYKKPKLKSFTLRVMFGTSGAALRELGKWAGTLRDISFEGRLPEEGALEELVCGSPLPQNVEVNITNFGNEQDVRNKNAEHIVCCFLVCRDLRQLIISSPTVRSNSSRLESIADQCVRFRFKSEPRTRVSVLGMDYLP